MTSKTDVTVFEGLSIVKVRGYETEWKGTDETRPIDLPGDANWLLETYGMASEPTSGPGILWQDYDHPDRDFAILIDSAEVDAFRSHAENADYEILSAEEVTEPTNFGDGGAGTVEILKHRDGWVVLD